MRYIEKRVTEAYCGECGLTMEYSALDGRLEIPGGYTGGATREQFELLVEDHREECEK